RSGAATPLIHALTVTMLAGGGLALAALALCWRTVWLALLGDRQVAPGPRSTRTILLIWLAASLLIAEYVFLVGRPNGTSAWLDALLAALLVLVAGRWLDPLAAVLAQRRPLGLAVLGGLLLAILAALPWLLRPSGVGDGLWHTVAGDPVFLDT